jgi:hypothetical protein
LGLDKQLVHLVGLVANLVGLAVGLDHLVVVLLGLVGQLGHLLVVLGGLRSNFLGFLDEFVEVTAVVDLVLLFGEFLAFALDLLDEFLFVLLGENLGLLLEFEILDLGFKILDGLPSSSSRPPSSTRLVEESSPRREIVRSLVL